MKNWIILILALALIIAILVSFWINREVKQINDTKVEQMRQAYKDSTEMFDVAHTIQKRELDSAIAYYKERVEYGDSVTTNLKTENKRLKEQSKKFRTPRVEELIESDHELKKFILVQDSLINQQGFTIDSLEVQRRMEQRLVDQITKKFNESDSVYKKESAYLRAEVVKRDSVIDEKDNKINKLENSSKKKNWFIGFLIALNLVPRS